MRVTGAKNAYALELKDLRNERNAIAKKLREAEAAGLDGGRYDRVELSRELARADKEYARLQAQAERQAETEWETLMQDLKDAKEQGDAMAESMQDMFKCLETARRIAEGSKVPAEDEKKLMEYSHELYMAAKNMAFLRSREKRKEYDSLWDEEAAVEEEAAGRAASGVDGEEPSAPESAGGGQASGGRDGDASCGEDVPQG